MSGVSSIKKSSEIQTLYALYSRASYFRDAFSNDDFNQMIENIKNDFPLLFSTTYGHAKEHWDIHTKSIIDEKQHQIRYELTMKGIVREIVLHDIFDEGSVKVAVEFSDDGHGYTFTVSTQYSDMVYSDIADGIARLYRKIAGGVIQRIISKHPNLESGLEHSGLIV